MTNQNDKFGIVISIVVTGILLGVIGNISASQDGSISSQGENVIDRTTNEIENVPEKIQDITTDALDIAEEIVDESDSIGDAIDTTSEIFDDELPSVPKVVKQSEGKLLELVSIPPETSVPGCEESNTCYLPVDATISPSGEVIWTNHDMVAHTVTSGNIRDGPDGLFDSGLIMPNETYSIQLDLAFEYDYFCIVHPWMEGTVVVA